MTATAKKKEKLPTWDLTDFYAAPDAPAVGKDIKACERQCAAFAARYAGKVAGLPASELAQSIVDYEVLQELFGKLGSYAQLLYAGEMLNPKIGQFYQNITETLTRLSSQLVFYTLEINKIPESAMRKHLLDAGVAKYAPWLREVRSFKPYELSMELETMLHEKSVTGRSAWSRLFDETIAGLHFPYKGKQLTEPQALDLLSSPDAKARREIAKVIGTVFGDHAKTFALITNTIAKDKEIEDTWRKFPRPISSRNLANQVEDEVVDALIASVKRSYPRLSHRYYKLKAKWFGVKQLPYWDRNAPLPKVKDHSWSWSESKELVLSSYAAFSPALAKIGKRFFDNDWIDAPTRPGKATGAFAHGTVPSVHPYLLLNHQGKTRDVMTLAHELGHGVHQVLAAKQGALLADTPLTLAETASVFGEQLTFREIIRREKDAKLRKSLIASKVEDMLNTVVRQIAMCEFEACLHVRAGREAAS